MSRFAFAAGLLVMLAAAAPARAQSNTQSVPRRDWIIITPPMLHDPTSHLLVVDPGAPRWTWKPLTGVLPDTRPACEFLLGALRTAEAQKVHQALAEETDDYSDSETLFEQERMKLAVAKTMQQWAAAAVCIDQTSDWRN
jgi:hypothetical protein